MNKSRRAFLTAMTMLAGLRPRRGTAFPIVPPFRSASTLRAAVWLGERCWGRTTARIAPTADGALRAAIRADFAAGRAVQIDGWLLSETEVALYRRAASLKRGNPNV